MPVKKFRKSDRSRSDRSTDRRASSYVDQAATLYNKKGSGSSSGGGTGQKTKVGIARLEATGNSGGTGWKSGARAVFGDTKKKKKK